MAVAAMQYSDRQPACRTLVVGLGASGYSAVRYLVGRGEIPVAADSRANPPMIDRLRREFPGVEVHLGPFSPERFGAFDRLVVSPGVWIGEPAIRSAREAGAEIVGDVELFARIADAPVIAVTGSNGKSTVTRLVGDLMTAAGIDARVGGNIGVPVLDLVDDDPPEFYVLELSSFQLETTSSLAPACSVVLNVAADHMDRYADLGEYARAKARIYDRAGVCVVNLDDPLAASLAGGGCSRRVGFGLGVPEANDFGVIEGGGRRWLAHGGRRLVAVDEIRLEGSHNAANMLAALALVDAAGTALDDVVLERARSFAGLPHRLELVAEHGGVRWINDSKGTNVGATSAAIGGFDRPIVLIGGGQGKGADFSPLADAARGRLRAAILFGEDRDALARALAPVVEPVLVDSLASAVEQAAAVAREGDVVLFSPACASFDMFRNFEHRGDAFRALVQEVVACRR